MLLIQEHVHQLRNWLDAGLRASRYSIESQGRWFYVG